jgi:Mrp family chromosome partitioning ATPase/capsular polysaccharide biosynthesis protein
MNQTTDASAMFAPIWRRRWLILTVGVLVALGTYFYYKHQRPTYQAATQVYLGAGAEEQVTLSGTVLSGKKSGVPEPSAQAVLINSPIVKSVVRQQLRKERGTRAGRTALAGKVKAKASEKSQFITITAEARSAAGAALLANVTAQTYVNRQNGKYHHAIESAIALSRRQVRRIEASSEARAAEATQAAKGAKGEKGAGATAKGKGSSAAVALQTANLISKINQLESNLAIVNVRQVNPVKPKAVKQLSASPKRNALFGFFVGLLLASFVAYALARMDNRLRSLSEIEEAFGTGILTALAAVRRPIVIAEGQPRPSKQLRESLERLHTTLQFGGAAGQERPRKVLFVSANGGDGQTTVIAGLALVQRDAGQATAIIEADLRHPTLARLLGLDPKPGLPAVLDGQLSLQEALQGVGGRSPQPAAPELGAAGGPVATVSHTPVTGSASVLVGAPVANPSALLASPAMDETLRALAESSDFVLVDAPPPLEVSDAMPLLHLVDAIVIVARVGQTRASSAQRLVQLLTRTPSAPVLGVVANGASQKDIEKYGFSTYSGRSWRSRSS